MRAATLRVGVYLLSCILLATTAGCGNADGRGVLGSAFAGSQAGHGANGPLLDRALRFDDALQAEHAPDGLVFNLHRDLQTGAITAYDSTGDSCIWTGLYVATEALRFRVTGDPVALRNMERSLWALHRLQEITGEPGFVARAFGDPRYIQGEPGTGPYAGLNWIADTSRDQYTGLFVGYALAFDVIADPVLKDTVRVDVLQIAQRLMRDNLRMVVTRNGTTTTHFDLNPDYFYQDQLTPQNWATVDDFPLNVITQAIPYDPDLVQALSQMRVPPIRSGEALRALMFFKAASRITADPSVEAYYRQLADPSGRDFLNVIRDYGAIVEDLLHGQNLHMVSRILTELGDGLVQALQAWIAQRYGLVGNLVGPLVGQLASAILQPVLTAIGDGIADAIQFLSNPQNLQTAQTSAQAVGIVGQILMALGERDAGRALIQFSQTMGPYLQAGLDGAADSLRSYVGQNLTFSSLYGLMFLETDPAYRAVYQDALERNWFYINDEMTPYYNFIHAAWLVPGPRDIPDGLQGLRVYWPDLANHRVDNSSWPGLRVSPWPDRFGHVGNLALDPFPVDRRAPHHFMWQEHPRKIVEGADNGEENSGVGYILAYWMGRYHAFIGPND